MSHKHTWLAQIPSHVLKPDQLAKKLFMIVQATVAKVPSQPKLIIRRMNSNPANKLPLSMTHLQDLKNTSILI